MDVARPENPARMAFHVASGAVAFTLLYTLGDTATIVASGSFAAFAWTLEISRRYSERVNDLCMWVLGRVAHEHERRVVNSATWYSTALFLVALLRAEVPAAIAVTTLAIGDPSAAFVGRRWGRHRIARGRSLEGGVAFAVTGFVASYAVVALAYPSARASLLGLAAAGALAGAVAEAASRNLDDNLTVPVASALAAYAAHALT